MRQLKAAGYPIREIDCSCEPGASEARKYGIIDLPTFVVVVDGLECKRLVGGGHPPAALAQIFNGAVDQASAQPRANATVSPEISFAIHAAGGSESVAGRETFAEPMPGRVVPIDEQPRLSRPGARAAPVADKLISATVRLSIEDPDGKSSGTGTIIDAREGKALVLTCGHLFRSSGGKGPIELSLFTPGPNGAEARTTVEGTLIDYDLDRDLALVCFAPDSAVVVAPVAPADKPMEVGETATSVGCEHGANPTAWPTRITAIDRYQGPPNIEAARAPVEGRSGGGLFNATGQLVGVCNAADPDRDEGLYASLPSIHAKLDAMKLAFVYQTPSAGAAQATTGGASDPLAAMTLPFEVRGQNPTPAANPFPRVTADERQPTAEPAAALVQVPATSAATPIAAVEHPLATTSAALSPQDQAMLEEISRRGVDSEVICIIRPREAGGRSEVIKLDRASPALVRALGGAAPPAVATSAGDASPAAAGQPLVR
jgi:S1-C subfamily serine protease